jgi:hypothetical protein
VANKYPYVASAGPLIRTLEHLRRSFPKEVTADTLRKLGVAPKNEAYVINVIRFLGVIDDEGKKIDAKARAFVQHKDEEFAKELEAQVREAYEELFELHGDGAWELDRSSLTQFFRTSDHSTDLVGTRQAGTFVALANLSGHGSPPARREGSPTKREPARKAKAQVKSDSSKKKAAVSRNTDTQGGGEDGSQQVGLTVRIEVNLPADGDQETYDRIFRSIRTNLIDGR